MLADELGYLFFDTGLMYRAITWESLRKGIEVRDESLITELAETTEIDIQPPSIEDGRYCDILADGVDITWEVRRPEVDSHVSLVSSYHGVRQAMTTQQRRIGLRGKVVMAGRDIGTVVLPDADLKIYLVASVEERARRRYQESLDRGEPASYDEILIAMRHRDQFDSTREIAPMRPAKDAIVIDSDQLDVGQVLEEMKHLIGLMP